jgi:flavin reductase
MLDRHLFRSAMARLGAAVNVVTTDGEAGKAGITATAVTSVSDEPSTLLVCINRSSRSNEIFRVNGVLCVNCLSAEQEGISKLFASPAATEERFSSASWKTLATGAPVLIGAAVSFDARISQIVEVGTHGVIFAQVEAAEIHESPSGLIYFNRTYHRLPIL